MFFLKKKNHAKFPSELRFDLVSEDWVVIATGRSKRPDQFKEEDKKEEKVDISNCPFCNIETQEKPVLIMKNNKEADSIDGWTLAVIPNKYPAFLPYPDLDETIEGGIYKKMNAVGFHEVVITRDHKNQLADFSQQEVEEVFNSYQIRYLNLMNEKFVNHISIFHNHGEKAGASIAHPHSQIITTPLVDVDLKGALERAQVFWKEQKECVYCKMNRWERKIKSRIVFENERFQAVCPFASKTAFQVIISPKKHLSHFERITENEKKDFAEVFSVVIKKIKKGKVKK